jgi:hypothetical protein
LDSLSDIVTDDRVLVAVAAAVLGGLAVKFSNQIVAALLWLPRIVGDFCWRLLAPRNPFHLAYRRYRRHALRSHLGQIENPVGPPGRNVPIEHGFAPLRLLTAGEPITDLADFIARESRAVIIGRPGSGKTTLVKRLIHGVLSTTPVSTTTVRRVPVFITLRDVGVQRHGIEQAAVAALAQFHFPGAGRFVSAALEQGRMLLVLDGLDEVGDQREFIVQQIRSFCAHDSQRATPNHVIVTCRESSYETRDLDDVLPHMLRVEPFTNENVRRFLTGWPPYRGRHAIELYPELQAAPEVMQACRNPLLLSILTGLYLVTEQRIALPRGRQPFYKAALDELLVHRPARRGMAQAFRNPDDKLLILQQVALTQLLRIHEDSEVVTRETLIAHAQRVLPAQSDFDRLLHDLVEINGVLRHLGGRRYTFAHRTFQEYLAAREAARTLSTDEVLRALAPHPSLYETLLFYCSIVDNVRQAAQVLAHFMNAHDIERAAECLVHMAYPPEQRIVDELADALLATAKAAAGDSSRLARPIELLSALSQRSAKEFDGARRCLDSAIAIITGGQSIGALEAALATVPDLAMRLVPALLDHPDAEHQAAGVHLLGEQGSVDAMEQLIAALGRAGRARAEAGRALASLLTTRNLELRHRVHMFPAASESLVPASTWPLEELLPARIAVSIIAAIASGPDEPTSNRAIDAAVRYVRETGATSLEALCHRRQWQRLRLSTALLRLRHSSSRILFQAFSVVYMAAALGLALLVLRAHSGVSESLMIGPGNQIRIVAYDLRPLRGAVTELRRASSKTILANDKLSNLWPNALSLPALTTSEVFETRLAPASKERVPSVREVERLLRLRPPSRARDSTVQWLERLHLLRADIVANFGDRVLIPGPTHTLLVLVPVLVGVLHLILSVAFGVLPTKLISSERLLFPLSTMAEAVEIWRSVLGSSKMVAQMLMSAAGVATGIFVLLIACTDGLSWLACFAIAEVMAVPLCACAVLSSQAWTNPLLETLDDLQARATPGAA